MYLLYISNMAINVTARPELSGVSCDTAVGCDFCEFKKKAVYCFFYF